MNVEKEDYIPMMVSLVIELLEGNCNPHFRTLLKTNMNFTHLVYHPHRLPLQTQPETQNLTKIQCA